MVILEGKPDGNHLGPWNAVKAWILQVDDATAVQADQVMMRIKVWSEARCRARVVQPQGKECFQDVVDRRTKILGQGVSDGVAKLLDGRVDGTLQDYFEDDAPLDSNRQAAFVMGGEKLVHALQVVCRAHSRI